MSVEVDFIQWGVEALAPGKETVTGYGWIMDGSHWSRMSALLAPWSPAGGSIQIVTEWAAKGTLWVHWRNNGTDYAYWAPTVIVAPSRY